MLPIGSGTSRCGRAPSTCERARSPSHAPTTTVRSPLTTPSTPSPLHVAGISPPRAPRAGLASRSPCANVTRSWARTRCAHTACAPCRFPRDLTQRSRVACGVPRGLRTALRLRAAEGGSLWTRTASSSLRSSRASALRLRAWMTCGIDAAPERRICSPRAFHLLARCVSFSHTRALRNSAISQRKRKRKRRR